jgi:hypothetical protein
MHQRLYDRNRPAELFIARSKLGVTSIKQNSDVIGPLSTSTCYHRFLLSVFSPSTLHSLWTVQDGMPVGGLLNKR